MLPAKMTILRCGRRELPAHFQYGRRFSLIELLVVISIISVLASLLLPALQRAKGLAHTTVCANNIKQHSVTMRLYADDYRGYIPPLRYDNSADSITGDFVSAVAGGEYGGYGNPLTAFQGYEQGNPISGWGAQGDKEAHYVCPSDQNPNNTVNTSSRKRISYGISLYFYLLNDRTSRYGSDYVNIKAFNLTRLKKPTESAFMADCDDSSLNDFSGRDLNNDTFVGSLSTDSYGQSHINNLTLRHGGGAAVNVLFADGHAAKYGLPILPYSLSGSWCDDN